MTQKRLGLEARIGIEQGQWFSLLPNYPSATRGALRITIEQQ